jgi:hypothetical protein
MTLKEKAAQNPLILRYHRLMDAFAKSDDERDFYLNKVEGFIVYMDLSKNEKEITALEKEIIAHSDNYSLISKLTFYETKKLMEGFVNEKVYDIDTKEKLIEIIQSKDPREHFLEFIYDNHTELDKWQQFYQERSRIRIIEWLRDHNFVFVFEEDLEVALPVLQNIKKHIFEKKAPKDVISARKTLEEKSKTYYSNEALNPRPKRGRPPKQVIKVDTEPQYTEDLFLSVPNSVRAFLYTPNINNASSIIFSSKFGSEKEFLANLKNSTTSKSTKELEALTQRLASLQDLSSRLATTQESDDQLKAHKKTRIRVKSLKSDTTEVIEKARRIRTTSSAETPKKVPKKKLSPLKKNTEEGEVIKPRRLAPAKVRKKKT